MASSKLDDVVIDIMREVAASQGCTCGDELTMTAVIGMATAATERTATFPLTLALHHVDGCPQGKRLDRLDKAAYN